MASRKQRRLRKQKRNRKQVEQVKEERVAPTPERLAKGDIEYTQAKSYRSVASTVIDQMFAEGRLGGYPKSVFRKDAFLKLYNLAVATSMFNADVIEFHPAEIGFSTENDDISALDKFRGVMGQVQRRNSKILTELCAYPHDRLSCSDTAVIEALDDLMNVFERQYERMLATHYR